MALLLTVSAGHSQQADLQPRTISGFEPRLPITPAATSREAPPLQVGRNEAMFEIVVGQGRLITTQDDIVGERAGVRSIAVGDPSVLDFEIIGPRHIRVVGQRLGTTDLSITTEREVEPGRISTGAHSIEVQVVADLDVLSDQLRAVFPGAALNLRQVRDHLVVEGQARDAREVNSILEMIQAYLLSVQPELARDLQMRTDEQEMGRLEGTRRLTFPPAQIINLIRVPGPQQVLLKVKIAELNRTALRQVGADILAVDPRSGNIFGTQIGGGIVDGLGTLGLGGLTGVAAGATGPSTTAFGIFPSGDFELLLRLLRRNSLLKIHAEPNLVTMSGHPASFLAGGEFPIPVPQIAGGVANAITVQFREFGVRLNFLPYILDEDTVRLTVEPEVSSIDFTLGTTLVVGGDPVPGLNTRRASTTLEMRQGQTLAMAGLLQVTIDAQTSRIPGIGDLPYIGPLFSNTSNNQIEKELLVLVTPFVVEPMAPHEVPPCPGDDVYGPNDCEFFLLNRIEGRTGVPYRATTDHARTAKQVKLEHRRMRGPYGFSE